MKYFFDTEFIEGYKKPIKWLPTIGKFNKPYHSIQLISIGIVAEDGREYYAISRDFNPNDANDWVKENVLAKLPPRQPEYPPHGSPRLYEESMRWRTNKRIAHDVFRFIHAHVIKKWDDKISFAEEIVESAYKQGEQPHEFYAYYAGYDWVVFCSLFGTMMDLPKGFPMYCRDLKQRFDEVQFHWIDFLNEDERTKRCRELNLYSSEVDLKKLSNYPTQQHEHNALDDAKWNFKLYQFLKQL